MKRFIINLIFVLLIFIGTISAQNKISFSIGGGYVSSAINKTKLPFWGNGYIIKVSTDYSILKKVSLFLAFSYQNNSFDKNLFPLTVPAMYGYNYEINGKNSILYTISVGTKIYSTNHGLRPFTGIGAGILFINQGKIEVTNITGGLINNSINNDSYSGERYTVPQVNVNAGFELMLFKNLQLILEGDVVYGFNGPMYIPITASIKMDI